MGAHQTFQVDLRGMVDLLARHLYSGPRVYVRELLQNAVDAVTARREVEPDAPATVRIVVHPDGPVGAPGVICLDVTDSGIGLDRAQATELLATIGRRSKRDETFGLGREQYIGQFGIGMLAAFMVAQEIEVTSRSAAPGAVPVHWRGYEDGTFEIEEITDASAAAEIAVGTRVRLRARHDAEHWLSLETVTALASEFGSLLPIDVAISVPLADHSTDVLRRISTPELPWQVQHRTPSARVKALEAYCEESLGFTPMGVIDLAVPLAGVSGVAFILPSAVAPGSGTHRVYLKRMLLGTRVDGLLPDWAFFVRCVVDAGALSPTASREQLHTDEVLLATQEALSQQIKAWALAQLGSGSALARRFIETHHLALRALALTDHEMLDLVASVLPYETTDGGATLAEVAQGSGEVLYCATTAAYRRIASVARAQRLMVVNAGYVYDAELLAALAKRPGWKVRELVTEDLEQVLRAVPPERELAILDAIDAGTTVLEPLDCDLLIRSFAPDEVPAMLLRDREGEHQRDLAREAEAADEVWGDVLSSFRKPAASRRLVLNDASEVVRDLLSAYRHGEVFSAGLRSLYLSAVMLAGEGLRGAELDHLNSSLSVLLKAGLSAGSGHGPDDVTRESGDGYPAPEGER